MTHVRETADEGDTTVIGDATSVEGMVGEVVVREGSVEGATEVDCGDAPSETRLYVVTEVPTRPRSNRASQQVVLVLDATARTAKSRDFGKQDSLTAMGVELRGRKSEHKHNYK
jgi:hypothetical protein